jgi:hypothetical protein
VLSTTITSPFPLSIPSHHFHAHQKSGKTVCFLPLSHPPFPYQFLLNTFTHPWRLNCGGQYLSCLLLFTLPLISSAIGVV